MPMSLHNEKDLPTFHLFFFSIVWKTDNQQVVRHSVDGGVNVFFISPDFIQMCINRPLMEQI